MKPNDNNLTEKILELTLEIIYLLTGEGDIYVKKTAGDGQNPITVPLCSLLITGRNNEQKILQVTQKIIQLLTGESGSWSDFNILIKKEEEEDVRVMREQECDEGHKDLYKDVMMEDQPPLTSPDASRKRNPPERCRRPPDSRDSTQEDQELPDHDEVKAEEEMHVKGTEIMATITQEKSLDAITGRHNGWNTSEGPLTLSADYKEDHSMVQYSPRTSIITKNIQNKLDCIVRSADQFTLDEFKDISHSEIPNFKPSFNGDPSYHENSHPNNLPPFQDCIKSLIENHDLVVHQLIPTGEKPFSCSVCEKSFPAKSGLVQHLRIHTREKPFSCSECGKTYKQKSKLIQHQRHHTGVNLFSCSECEKFFIYKSKLIQHQRIHTGEKPFSCSECGKSFNVSAQLKTHQRVHTGEKPFSCPECGKSFSHKGNCDKHMRIHTGEKPFSCPECGKCFALKSTLIVHQRVHPPGKVSQLSLIEHTR